MDAKINQVSPLLYDVWLWWPHERSCPVKDVVGGIGTLSGTWGVRDAIAELRLLPSVVYGPGVCVCVCVIESSTPLSPVTLLPSLPTLPLSLGSGVKVQIVSSLSSEGVFTSAVFDPDGQRALDLRAISKMIE